MNRSSSISVALDGYHEVLMLLFLKKKKKQKGHDIQMIIVLPHCTRTAVETICVNSFKSHYNKSADN